MPSEKPYLVTGANGMLGRAVVDRLRAKGEPVIATDLPDVDLTDEDAARAFLNDARPGRVIHCAAYTNVDGAESDAEACFRVNARMPGNIARTCAEIGAWMLLVSTDFVFDGKAREPYSPDAPAAPLSVYGRSKLEGEKAVIAALGPLERCQIVRTAWLYGPGKRNFVSGMLERLSRGERVRVVDDQRGSPTFTLDLASVLIAVARAERAGVFHATNAGTATWRELTRKTAELAGLDPGAVEAIRTEDYPTPARRPAWSALDCSATWALGIEAMRAWTEALGDYVRMLKSSGS